MKLDKIRSAIIETKATSRAATQKLANAVEQAKDSRKLIAELKQSIKSSRKALKAAKKEHHAAVHTRKKATALLKESHRELKKLEAKLAKKSSATKNGQPTAIPAGENKEMARKSGPTATARKVPAGTRENHLP